MLAITIDSLGIAFGTRAILDDVTFSLEENDKLGIIGVNGCGKSTLFKLICSELVPDSGAIYISKGKTLGVLRQDDAFAEFENEGEADVLSVMLRSFPELLAAEARLARLEERLAAGDMSAGAEYSELQEKFIADGGLEFRGRCASTLQKMGFDEQMQRRPISSFSGGQRTRLALSRELCREPDILMLDEPTNHLDTETLEWLESFLASYKKCVMVISHDRYFLDRVTNKTLLIENTHAKLYSGGYSASMEARRTDREIALRHYKNQQKEIARQEAYIAQQRAWNRERNIIAAESRQKLLDKMERVEKPENAPRSVRIGFCESQNSGNEVLKVKNIGFAYAGGAPLFENVDFTLHRTERMFFCGPNGCGKSTLIKLLVQRLSPSSGYIEYGYNVNVGYYDQENQNLNPQNSVLEELWEEYRGKTELEIRNTLALFRFVGEDVYKLVRELSGGERARLTLAKLTLKSTNLLVLDEPTNHLDIDTREVLEDALLEYGGTVVTVSHDRYFVSKLATRFIDMSPDGCYDINVLPSADAYAELLADRARRKISGEQKSASAQNESISSAKEQYLKNKKESAERRNAEKRLARMRAEAEKIEKEIEDLDIIINGEAACDYERLGELCQKKDELESRLLELYEEI